MFTLHNYDPRRALGAIEMVPQRLPDGRISYVPGVRGLGQLPTIDQIALISKTFPRCFSSRTILPAIQRSISFANTITTQGLSQFSGTASPDAVKREIDRDISTLQYWQGRLATEEPAVYCSDMTRQVLTKNAQGMLPPKQSASDYQQVLNAIVGPYQTLYGIEGARATVNSALIGLYADLALGFYNPLTGAFNIPTWAKIAGVAAVGLLALSLISKISKPFRGGEI